MLNIDAELSKYIRVKHNIENDEQFILELANAIDMMLKQDNE